MDALPPISGVGCYCGELWERSPRKQSSNAFSEDGLKSQSWVQEKRVLRVGAAGSAYIKSFQDWKDELGRQNSSLRGWGQVKGSGREATWLDS